ncbi:MAG: hypothetical protein EOO60_03105, partial [Hymenobacter sp.]
MFTEYTTHYKSVFIIQPHALSSQQAAWEGALGNIYGWLRQNLGKHSKALLEELFHINSFLASSLGGKQWMGSNSTIIKTQSAGEEYPPKLWSCRYEHPDRDLPHDRRWRTDIGIECLPDGCLRVGVRLSHCLRDEYMGAPLVSPEPTVPLIIKYLMKGGDWDVRLGSLRLTPTPHFYGEGQIKQLWQLLQDPQREAPVVVVTGKLGAKYPIDTAKLSEQLTGVAAVICLPYETKQEQTLYIPKAYQCYPGSIRVYQRGLDSTRKGDAVRHRYFSAPTIDAEGAKQISQWFVPSLIRQATLAHPRALFSPDDVEDAQRTARLNFLRSQVEEVRNGTAQLNIDTQEFYELLEKENTRLEQEARKLDRENKQLQEDVLNADIAKESALSAAHEEVSRARRDKLYSLTEAKALRKINGELASASAAVNSFSELPRTLLGVVKLASNLWPSRIVFTPRALTSVASATYQSGVDELWFGLYLLAQKLWPLYFEQPPQIPQDLELAFHADASSWTLTHSEGSETRKSAKLIRHREDEFEGIDFRQMKNKAK